MSASTRADKVPDEIEPWVVQQPYGPWLLAVIAVGLVAYGLYADIMVRYRRMPIE
jgi:hypothetical protein